MDAIHAIVKLVKFLDFKNDKGPGVEMNEYALSIIVGYRLCALAMDERNGIKFGGEIYTGKKKKTNLKSQKNVPTPRPPNLQMKLSANEEQCSSMSLTPTTKQSSSQRINWAKTQSQVFASLNNSSPPSTPTKKLKFLFDVISSPSKVMDKVKNKPKSVEEESKRTDNAYSRDKTGVIFEWKIDLQHAKPNQQHVDALAQTGLDQVIFTY